MIPRSAAFCYHDLRPDDALAGVSATHRPYVVSPATFREHVLAIRDAARQAVGITEFVADLAGGTVSVTFDDGMLSDYTEAFPVLREVGMRATFFIVPTLVGQPGYVTWAQLREMVAAGMEIGSHSMTHPFMDRLSRREIDQEFHDSKLVLEDRLGLPVRSASLPRGAEPPNYRDILADIGYRVFCTSRVGWWHPGNDPLAVPRVGVRRGLPAEVIGAIAAAAPRSLWKLQVTDTAKDAVKRSLGHRSWTQLRAPLLALRDRLL